MSDTPRTDGCLTEILDAYGFVHQGNCPQRWVNHSRELERELNSANQIIRQQQLLEEENQRLTAKVAQLYAGAEEQRQRIKRLEEAGDAIFLLAEKHAPEYWLYTQTAFNNWLKAKESKP